MLPAVLLVVTILSSLASAKVLNIMEFGAVASSRHANVTNQQAINRALAASKPGDVVLVPAQKVCHGSNWANMSSEFLVRVSSFCVFYIYEVVESLFVV